MVSGEPYDADKAYKDSKLCNMLFSYELERRLTSSGSKVTVNAFGPGLITRTGLFRHQQPLFVKAFDLITNTFNVAESVDGGGNTLLYMLNDASLEGVGGTYYNNTISPGSSATGHAFVVGDSSEESMNIEEAKKLWSLSEKLTGLA
jgi:protochlorophyllide reductase